MNKLFGMRMTTNELLAFGVCVGMTLAWMIVAVDHAIRR